MIVELFYAEGCKRCSDSRSALKATAQQALSDVVWREVNVLDELDYAIEVGVLNLPAIAINKELVFASLPSPEQLKEAILQRNS